MNFKHSGALGDIIYSLPVIKQKWQDTGIKHNLYIELDVPVVRHSYPAKKNFLLDILFRIPEKVNFELKKRGKKEFNLNWLYRNFYPRVGHPAGNVHMNRAGYDLLYPLLIMQPYIETVAIYSGQKIDIDFEAFRNLDTDYSCGHIPNWHMQATGIVADIQNPWLDFKYKAKYAEKIVWARSSRVINEKIDFSVFKNTPNLIFVGLDSEYQAMKKIVPNLVHEKTNDATELASAIGSAKLFISNSTFAFAIAEATKVPRLYEECSWCKTVQPINKGFKFTNQAEFEKALKSYIVV